MTQVTNHGQIYRTPLPHHPRRAAWVHEEYFSQEFLKRWYFDTDEQRLYDFISKNMSSIRANAREGWILIVELNNDQIILVRFK